MSMIEASASSGFPMAVAYCHFNGRNGLNKDVKKAFDMCVKQKQIQQIQLVLLPADQALLFVHLHPVDMMILLENQVPTMVQVLLVQYMLLPTDQAL